MHQFPLELRASREESEVADEAHDARVTLRLLNDGIEVVGRKNLCYALEISESLLSKKLSGADGRSPCHRILSYVARRYEPLAQHLARRWGYAPLVRPEHLTPEQELARLKAQLHDAGEFGRVLLERALGQQPQPVTLKAVGK